MAVSRVESGGGSGKTVRIAWLAGAAWMFMHASNSPAGESWFADIERYTSLRETRLDVAGPEPASFTALGVAPFVTAQALASSDVAVSAAQIVDDYGHPRFAIGIDFAPTLLTSRDVTLGQYQSSHPQRVVSRLQLSVAMSKGESVEDRSTRIAPTLRIVLHEQRDSRVHRGPGSLQDCFERHVVPPEALREQLAALAEQLKHAEAQQRDDLQAQWEATQARYRAALKETVRQGMRFCRDDPEVAAYTWNATGFALGFSPSLGNGTEGLDSIKPKGMVVYATQAIGFDGLGTSPTYAPSFLGAHAQVLTQLLYRLDEPLPDPLKPRTSADADELVASVRLRGGTAPWSGSIEAALIHDWFGQQRNDTLARLSAGMDAHVARGVWLSFAVGRTFWRNASPDHTSAGLSIKWSLLD